MFKSQDVDEYKATMPYYGLEPLSNGPTTISSSSATCIDHIYTTIKVKFKMDIHAVSLPLGTTDHSLIALGLSFVNTSCISLPLSAERSDHIDYAKLYLLLDSIDWSDIYEPFRSFGSLRWFFIKSKRNKFPSVNKVNIGNHP